VLLEDKNAVIYGEGVKMGGAVALAFTCEGAKVFLTGRTLESLEEIAPTRTSKDGRD
jgi:NADP-dependent 3-hydroxy acid dehydrogenase YdfG